MTWKQIEASREARLWIKEIFVPLGLIGGACMLNPDIRAHVKSGFKKIKNKITGKKE